MNMILKSKASTLSRRLNRFILLVGILTLGASAVLIAPGAAISGEPESSNGLVSNVRFSTSGQLVLVYYQLSGEENSTYKVTLTVLEKSEPNFVYHPKGITGDVGVINGQPNGEKRIEWRVRDDFPNGLIGDDFYFVVKATEVKSEHVGVLRWIGAGAAVVLGAIAYAEVLRNPGHDTPSSYPLPPGRP